MLLVVISTSSLQSVHAQTVSILYLQPSMITPGQLRNNAFTVSVRLNLASDESINAFDVTLNYTNYGKVVNASQQLSTAGNIFSGGTYAPNTVGQCVDSNSTNPSSAITCSSGQVRLAQNLLGQTVPSGDYLLFNVTFNVGTGSSVFTLSATLVNPVDSATGFVNPRLIPYVAKGGAFANYGTVAFFNFWPLSGPSVLLGAPVTFDASSSLAIGTSIANYTWNFHDGSPTATLRSPSTSHNFASTGEYAVQLFVEDLKGGRANITRNVLVVPALGSLQLSPERLNGNGPIPGVVTIQIFNATPSVSTVPFATKTAMTGSPALFQGLVPGTYVLKFSGPSIDDYSKSETVIGGWTVTDHVYLTVIPSPPDYSGIIYLASTLVGVGVVFGLIVWRRGALRRKNSPRKFSGRAARKASWRGF